MYPLYIHIYLINYFMMLQLIFSIMKTPLVGWRMTCMPVYVRVCMYTCVCVCVMKSLPAWSTAFVIIIILIYWDKFVTGGQTKNNLQFVWPIKLICILTIIILSLYKIETKKSVVYTYRNIIIIIHRGDRCQ